MHALLLPQTVHNFIAYFDVTDGDEVVKTYSGQSTRMGKGTIN